MSVMSFGVGNVIPFPGKRKNSIHVTAVEKMDHQSFLDLIHSSKILTLSHSDQIARSYAKHFCILGLVDIEEQVSPGQFISLRPSEAFQNSRNRVWRVSKRASNSQVSLASLI